MRLGSTIGGTDIYSKYVNSGSQSVEIPLNGNPVHVRLESRIDGVWLKRDFQFDTTDGGTDPAAQLSSPTADTVLSNKLVQFQWSDGVGADSHILRVGTTFGGTDVFSKFVTDNSQWLEIPLSGNTLYIRLESRINGVWLKRDVLFQTTDGGTDPAAHLIAPAAETTLNSVLADFSWTDGTAVDSYILRLGTSPGATDIYSKYVSGGNQSVEIPLTGNPIYVQMESRINGVWLKRVYQFEYQ